MKIYLLLTIILLSVKLSSYAGNVMKHSNPPKHYTTASENEAIHQDGVYQTWHVHYLEAINRYPYRAKHWWDIDAGRYRLNSPNGVYINNGPYRTRVSIPTYHAGLNFTNFFSGIRHSTRAPRGNIYNYVPIQFDWSHRNATVNKKAITSFNCAKLMSTALGIRDYSDEIKASLPPGMSIVYFQSDYTGTAYHGWHHVISNENYCGVYGYNSRTDSFFYLPRQVTPWHNAGSSASSSMQVGIDRVVANSGDKVFQIIGSLDAFSWYMLSLNAVALIGDPYGSPIQPPTVNLSLR